MSASPSDILSRILSKKIEFEYDAPTLVIAIAGGVLLFAGLVWMLATWFSLPPHIPLERVSTITVNSTAGELFLIVDKKPQGIVLRWSTVEANGTRIIQDINNSFDVSAVFVPGEYVMTNTTNPWLSFSAFRALKNKTTIPVIRTRIDNSSGTMLLIRMNGTLTVIGEGVHPVEVDGLWRTLPTLVIANEFGEISEVWDNAENPLIIASYRGNRTIHEIISIKTR